MKTFKFKKTKINIENNKNGEKILKKQIIDKPHIKKYLTVINMVFCSKCGCENTDSEDKCKICGEFLVKEEYFSSKTYENFEDIFTDNNLKALDKLTIDGYNTVIKNIEDMGHDHLEKYYQNINRRNLTILDKIKALTLCYCEINYKSSGAELGSYSFNSINIDDRLDEANQISTLIHELSHHLFSEIFEQVLMYLWGCEKSDAIEALAWFTLIGSPLTQLTNEYCAHTCEGRFVPHGYQNYGSFNNILINEFDAEKDQDAIGLGLIFGNTIAQDILTILENFIDYDLRDEIKQQFKRDFRYPPKYDQILLESKEYLPDEIKIENMKFILKGGYEAAKNKEMKEILDTFKDNFANINTDWSKSH